MSDLPRLLRRLRDADIDFVLVGGYAAVLHGSSALTRDVDVCARLTPETIERLRAAFGDLHPVHRLSMPRRSFLDEPKPGVALNHLHLHTDLGSLDLLGHITGIGDFDRVCRDAIEVEIFGFRIRVIGVADLIQAKEPLGREKDLLVAKELRVIQDRTRR